MNNEQNLNEAYLELSQLIELNPQTFFDRYVSVSMVRGEEGKELELIIRATPSSYGKEYATQGDIRSVCPITLTINTLTQSASFQHHNVSSETLETTATGAIQDFALEMLAAIVNFNCLFLEAGQRIKMLSVSTRCVGSYVAFRHRFEMLWSQLNTTWRVTANRRNLPPTRGFGDTKLNLIGYIPCRCCGKHRRTGMGERFVAMKWIPLFLNSTLLHWV